MKIIQHDQGMLSIIDVYIGNQILKPWGNIYTSHSIGILKQPFKKQNISMQFLTT